MDEGSDRLVPGDGGAHQLQLGHALRGTCGAPCAAVLRRAADGDWRRQSAAGDRGADDAARRPGGGALEPAGGGAAAEARLAVVRGLDGDHDGAVRLCTSAAARLARAGDREPAERRGALLWLAVAEWSVLGDVGRARDHLARAAVLARDDEPAELAVPALALRALASTHAGDLAGAATTSRAALRRARDDGAPGLLAVALAAELQQLAARGDQALALAVCGRLREVDEHAREIAAAAVVPLLLETGRTAEAARLLGAVTSARRHATLLPYARAILLELSVRCALACGDGDDAHRHLHALEQLPYARTPLGGAVAGCAAAAVALADDRPLNAEVRATTAADQARRAPSRLLERRATVLAGHAQAALGAPEVAAERFAEAEAIGGRSEQQVESRWPRERDDLREAAAHGLTPRQFEIARLVAAGATNREVATALGISEHTVNTHLRVAFARLGVSRRTALAGALTRGRAAAVRASARD